MATQESTAQLVFFKPLAEHDNLNVAFLLARIAAKIRLTETGCWEWTGSRNKDGYGTVGTENRKTELLHRAVFRLCKGPLTPGEECCHDCPGGDNRACCNPSHLFAGSHEDNMRDAARKGRIVSRDSAGEKNPAAKLDWPRVRAIRARHAVLRAQGVSNPARMLADEEKVSEPTIRRIVNNVIWKDVG